jgi:UDP-N-acetylglucosamine 4,6-dehydratase/5-epimerase
MRKFNPDMIKIDKNLKNEFKGKSVLITGGTGSIGLGIIKQLVNYQPKQIRIFSNDENSIVEVKEAIGDGKVFQFMVGDVRDKDRLQLAMRNVDIVFHAAAMKHIDICEQNPFDAVKTNVIGTSNILELSIMENVSKVIFISTDKATNPSSTLGASKLLAERLTLDASSHTGENKTIFAIVRFGNVLGSRGSVFQIFQKQILTNNPLTVTDERMTRFIMSISDASKMILKVTNIAKDGEIFILKMPSVKIEELAKGMLNVFKKKLPNHRITNKIKILKSRERERFDEFLITNEEQVYCHDIGQMYKISKIENKKPVSLNNFNSKTSKKISKKELEKIINELMDEYITY